MYVNQTWHSHRVIRVRSQRMHALWHHMRFSTKMVPAQGSQQAAAPFYITVVRFRYFCNYGFKADVFRPQTLQIQQFSCTHHFVSLRQWSGMSMISTMISAIGSRHIMCHCSSANLASVSLPFLSLSQATALRKKERWLCPPTESENGNYAALSHRASALWARLCCFGGACSSCDMVDEHPAALCDKAWVWSVQSSKSRYYLLECCWRAKTTTCTVTIVLDGINAPLWLVLYSRMIGTVV